MHAPCQTALQIPGEPHPSHSTVRPDMRLLPGAHGWRALVRGVVPPLTALLAALLAVSTVGCQEAQNAGVTKVRRARTLLEQGDSGAAAEAARAALGDNPNDPAALRLLAIALELEEAYGEAANQYTRLLELDPKAHELKGHLGRVLALAGRPEEAKRAVADLRASAPKNVDALLLDAVLSDDSERRRHVGMALDALLGDVSQEAPAEVRLVRAEVAESLGDTATASSQREAAHALKVGNANTALALAELYRRRGRLGVVEELLSRVLEVAPDPQPVALQLVEVALRRGDVAAAKKALTHVKESTEPGPLMGHARVAMAEGRWQDALKLLEQAVPKLDGAGAELARFNLAEALLALERFPEVERELRTLLDGEFGYASAAMMLCDLLETTGRGAEIPALLTPLVAKHPNDGGVLARLGEAQMALGNKQGALTTYQRLAKLDEAAPRGYFLQGQALRALGKPQEAKAMYERAMKAAPGFIDAIDALVEMAMSGKRPQEALSLLNAELARAADNPSIHVRLASLHAAQQRFEEAEAAFKRATELAPQSGQVWFAWGEFAVARGERGRGRALFRTGLRNDPSNAGAWLRLGDLAYRDGERGAALKAFEQLLALEPDLVAAQNNVAMLLAELEHDLDRAETLARAAHAKAPSVAGITDTLGWVLVLRGKSSEAVPLLREAAAQLKSADTYYHLGAALMKAQDKAAAKQAFARMLRTDPQHPQAKAVKATLSQL